MSQIPYSTEAEMAVVGCMVAYPNETIPLFEEVLRPEDLFTPDMRALASVLVSMSRGGVQIDLVTVYQEISDRRMSKEITVSALAELATQQSSYLGFSAYVATVLEKSKLRRLYALSNEVSGLVQQTEKAEEIIAHTSKTLDELSGANDNGTQFDAIAATRHFVAWQGQVQAGQIQARLATGFQQFDRLNGGLYPAGFHIFAARPSVGKTTILLNLLENLCRGGMSVGFISLEMDCRSLMERIYAFVANIDSRRFQGRLHDSELAKIALATTEIEQWRFSLDECYRLDVHKMKAKCKAMVRRGAQVLMLDYLQLMEGASGDDRKRYEHVTEISRCLKLTAKELNVPILVAAQLNREAANGQPGLHNIRESGAIEQDADVAVILSKKDPDQQGAVVSVIWDVAKYRNGATGSMLMTFDKAHQRFVDQP